MLLPIIIKPFIFDYIRSKIHCGQVQNNAAFSPPDKSALCRCKVFLSILCIMLIYNDLQITIHLYIGPLLLDVHKPQPNRFFFSNLFQTSAKTLQPGSIINHYTLLNVTCNHSDRQLHCCQKH